MEAFVANFVFCLFIYNIETVFLKFISFCKKRYNSSIIANVTEVLHVSDNFLVVNKPFDLVINSNDPNLQDTLQIYLRRLLPHLANPKLPHDFHFVHRLDYATSGVMCLALCKAASSAASVAFESRNTRKYYVALVRDHVGVTLLEVDLPVGGDPVQTHRMSCITGSISPRSAVTCLLVLQRGTYARSPATKVLLRPVTGRRHQLRVHCAAIGHPVVGDYTYSDRTDVEPYRMFLHAYRLVLPNRVEPLDIRTLDPFTCERGAPEWRPTEFVNPFDVTAFEKLDALVP